jgi:hypothetical protein
MRRLIAVLFILLCAIIPSQAVSKPHIFAFGKWMKVSCPQGPNETQMTELKIRPLYMDGRLRTYVFGTPHEITEQLFVVRRAFRINDELPSENSPAPRWLWQRGGWLLVDRLNGHMAELRLPEFDAYFSSGTWYRDYFAYCSVSEDGKKIFAVVEELGQRKPVLRQLMGELIQDGTPSSICETPVWQRRPPRVTFSKEKGEKLSYVLLRQGSAEMTVVPNDGDEEDAP